MARHTIVSSLALALLVAATSAACGSEPDPPESGLDSAVEGNHQHQGGEPRRDRQSREREGILTTPSSSLVMTSTGARLAFAHGEFELRAAAWRRGSRRVAVGPAPRASATDGRTAWLDHPSARQWYRADLGGFEHGLDVPRRPLGGAEGPLVLEIAVAGATPVLERAGEPRQGVVGIPSTNAVRLVRADGRGMARYDGLKVTDARGRRLAGRLGVRRSAIEITVDDAEAVYPIVIDPLIWDFYTSFQGANSGWNLGEAVAIDGGHAVLGAYHATHSGQSKAGLVAFVRLGPGEQWLNSGTHGADVPTADANFGAAVDISGDTAVVGAPGSSTAYVFLRSGATWSLQQVLSGSGDFGEEVAIEGDTLAVSSQSQAVVFTRSQEQWTEQQTVVSTGDVDLAGDRLLAGSRVYLRSGTTWTLEQTLAPSMAVGSSTLFGDAVALSSTRALVGSPGDGLNFNIGAVYVYERSGTAWTETHKLVDNSMLTSAFQGDSVAFDGNFAVIGISNDDFSDGAVTVRSVGGAWSKQYQFDGGNDMHLGKSVGLSQDWMVAGAPGSFNGLNDEGRVWFYALKLNQGSSCATGLDCHSGFCVDGVCCDAPCPEPCGLCNLPGDIGACSPVASGTQPKSTTCAYVCAGSELACPDLCLSSADCVAGHFCDEATATCMEKAPAGTPCTASAQCVSGACTDGFCCGEPCLGACATCDAGTCGPRPQGTSGTCGSRTCDGISLECPPQCFDDTGCIPEQRCDQGTCVDHPYCGLDVYVVPGAFGPQIDDCEPYGCRESEGGCLGDCGDDDECADDHDCVDGICIDEDDVDAGCGCRVGSGGGTSGRGLAALTLVWALARRRRRRRCDPLSPASPTRTAELVTDRTWHGRCILHAHDLPNDSA